MNPVFNQAQVAEIPILPDTYMGIQITRKESIGYVDKGIDDERSHHQCNNLIYIQHTKCQIEKKVMFVIMDGER